MIICNDFFSVDDMQSKNIVVVKQQYVSSVKKKVKGRGNVNKIWGAERVWGDFSFEICFINRPPQDKVVAVMMVWRGGPQNWRESFILGENSFLTPLLNVMIVATRDPFYEFLNWENAFHGAAPFIFLSIQPDLFQTFKKH